MLTYDKWQDALLGVAGAYAIYALPDDRREPNVLRTVIGNLRQLAAKPGGLRVPDTDLLAVALFAQSRESIPLDVVRSAVSWAARGAIPVLRWGVPLAIRLIQEHVLVGPDVKRWCDDLVRIEEAMPSFSVWTAWRSSPRRR